MKLSYIILYVDDVTKATEFYHKAFDLEVKFIHGKSIKNRSKSSVFSLNDAPATIES